MEQGLLTLPEHLRSLPVYGGVRVARSLIIRAVFCRSLFVLSLSIIVLSVLLRFTTSDDTFGPQTFVSIRKQCLSLLKY